MALKMRLRGNESIEQAVRRFKKLLERSGIPKELRKHEHYEKPCEVRRRAKLRKQKSGKRKLMPLPNQATTEDNRRMGGRPPMGAR